MTGVGIHCQDMYLVERVGIHCQDMYLEGVGIHCQDMYLVEGVGIHCQDMFYSQLSYVIFIGSLLYYSYLKHSSSTFRF